MVEKIGVVHLIKSYGGEDRKYLEVPRIEYLVLPKWDPVPKIGTEY